MNFRALLAAADVVILTQLGEESLVTYTPSVGAPVNVRGIFDSAYVLVDAGEAGASSSGPAVFLKLAGLPSDPREDEAHITVNGKVYTIRETKPDGADGVLILLYEA